MPNSLMKLVYVCTVAAAGVLMYTSSANKAGHDDTKLIEQ